MASYCTVDSQSCGVEPQESPGVWMVPSREVRRGQTFHSNREGYRVEVGRADGRLVWGWRREENPLPPPLPPHRLGCLGTNSTVSLSARLSVVRTTACSSRTKGKCILVDGVPMDRQVGALAPLGR